MSLEEFLGQFSSGSIADLGDVQVDLDRPRRCGFPEVIFAENQDEYESLPALQLDDRECTVVSRWKMSWRERLHVLFSGDLYVYVMTFGKPLQPYVLETECLVKKAKP